MLTSWLVQFGATFVPLSLIILFFAYQYFKGWSFYTMTAIAFILFLFGMWAFRTALKLARLEERKEDKKFCQLMAEIKGLRKDLTEIEDERRDNSAK